MDWSFGVARCAMRACLSARRIGAAPRGAGRGRRKLLLLRMLMVLATMSLAVGVSAASGWAQASDPPVTTPPPAGATAPPAEAIIDSVDPLTPCSGWYLQSSYGGSWPTDATWWEYTCAAVGGGEPSGSTRSDYYYWDGLHAASVYYGQRYIWYYMMAYDGPCRSWWDQAANQWYGPYDCSLIAPSGTAPTASFTVGCSGLDCSLDAGASADSDGTIQQYSWDFGDGGSGSGVAAQHAYAQPGSYTVTLTVTDNAGATATDASAVTLIGLVARGGKLKGVLQVELAWSGSAAASFEVYRNGAKIATVAGSGYTDKLGKTGPGGYTYQVCQATTSICSNQATVNF